MGISVEGIEISKSSPPVIVAELSANHNGSLERALSIVDAAADAGVQAIKLQTYTADTMTIDVDRPEFFIDDSDSLWKGRSLHDLYREAHTPWDWHRPLFERARKKGILCFSTPFDSTAVDLLEELNAPLYKVASFENNDLRLLRKIARTGKPVVVSTGMATVAEVHEAVQTIRREGNENIVLLKATSSYPASPEYSNILTIPHMASLFDVQVGLSDHTSGIGAALAAVAHGATMIEKHFTLSRADGGVDSAFSLEPPELAALVVESNRAWQSLGKVDYGITASEASSMRFRRSLYIVKDIEPGESLTTENVRSIRPGFGMAPRYLDEILGLRVHRKVLRGTPLSWELLR